MCGFAGVLHDGPTVDARLRSEVAGMAATLRHRGPDDDDVLTLSDHGVGFGFRRLSILDRSPAGRQPMSSNDGRYDLVFNGEIYNHRELRDRLGPGHAWRGHGDTETLVAAIAAWGVAETLPRLNGMFAIAVWDRRRRVMTLARDRFGEKPLHYGRVGDAVVFASELKAIRALPEFRGDLDRSALAAYLRHGFVPAPWTIYQGIHKVTPGTFVELRARSEPVVRTYWSLADVALAGTENPLTLSPADACDAVEELLGESVRLRMEADVKVGAFLSGGVDSSLITALMTAGGRDRVRTFSVGFHEEGYDEAAHASKVAEHFGTEHTELYFGPEEIQALLPELPSIYDEPYADISAGPILLLSRLARQSVTVALSGDGGDEIFGGYGWYRRPHSRRDGGWVPAPARRPLSRVLSTRHPLDWDRTWQRLGPVLPGGLARRRPGELVQRFVGELGDRDARDRVARRRSRWPDPTAVVRGVQEAPAAFADRGRWPDLPSLAEWFMYYDTVSILPEVMLTKVDRATMATSLEARAPMLDHRLVELAWRLPLEYRVGHGTGKWVLRETLDRHVPAALVDRPKAGFDVPVGSWLRAPLRDWAEEMLRPGALEEAGLEPAPVRTMWSEHLRGIDWQERLWPVLSYQAWRAVDRDRALGAAA